MTVKNDPDPIPGQCRAPRLTAWAVAAGCALAPAVGRAAQTVLPVTPPGSTDTDQAVLPPQSGLYIGLFSLPYSADRQAYDSAGHAVGPAFNVHVSSPIAGAAFLYVYPFTLFGGTLGSTYVQPFGSQTTSIGTGVDDIVPRHTAVGLRDAYTDILIWSKYVGLLGASPGKLPMNYGLTVAGAFSMILPTGEYNERYTFNLGGNAFVLDPNFALTYNTGPRFSIGDNTQISTRLFFAFPQPNLTDHYLTGDIVNLDWSVTEQFKRFRVGVAGYYQAQYANDRLPNGGTPPGGGKYSEGAIGPVVEYFFPSGMFVKAKYSWTVLHKNYIDQQFLLLSTGFKF